MTIMPVTAALGMEKIRWRMKVSAEQADGSDG